VSGALGVRGTLVGAGVLGALVTASALLVPEAREIEGTLDRRILFEPTPRDELPALRLTGPAPLRA
jgi:hypothetical protein